MVEANGTLEPMLDSEKSDGTDGAGVIAASRWPHLLVFLVIVLLLLSYLLPQERDKTCIQGFIVTEMPMSLVLQLFNPRF
jgi:hypothetical protein